MAGVPLPGPNRASGEGRADWTGRTNGKIRVDRLACKRICAQGGSLTRSTGSGQTGRLVDAAEAARASEVRTDAT